jgi:hypothetical protein
LLRYIGFDNYWRMVSHCLPSKHYTLQYLYLHPMLTSFLTN